MPDFAHKISAPTHAPDPTGPLRDWLSAIGRREGRGLPPEAEGEGDRRVVELPRAKAPVRAEAEDADVDALMAENLVLRARLATEDERLAAIETALVEELRHLRTLLQEEADRVEEMREERDLWMARAEELAKPLFQPR